MIDRSKKQMSLRKFRVAIADVRQVVEVSRRDPRGGSIQVLGFWTPYATHPADAVPLSGELVLVDAPPEPGGTTAVVDGWYVDARKLPDGHPFRIIGTPEDVAKAVPTARPFTKAEQAGRKKR